MKETSKPAISLPDEAARIYWEEIKKLPTVLKRLSIFDIKQIFDTAVIPAIEKIRALDRENR